MTNLKNTIKVKSIYFGDNKFRKFRNIKISFASRITLIAGHNAIGKSTILSLLASASGLTEVELNSYFGKKFSHDLNDIIHFDISELESKSLKAPWPQIIYEYANQEHWKNIRITPRGPETPRLRSVPSTAPNSPNPELTKQDGKPQLPTIYLGMLRMLPIGESNPQDVICATENMEEVDKEYLRNFINDVINNTASSTNRDITEQSIKYTKKVSSHPTYSHNVRSISLGQDSLSSIATAITSFHKIKRELGNQYRGGLLLIDEIDAGFHPSAQKKLIEALKQHARNLSLQIIATTHSSELIRYIHPESAPEEIRKNIPDKVIYLTGTITPSLQDWPLDLILKDMSLSPLTTSSKETVPEIKAYLEDFEATYLLKGILGMKRNIKQFTINNNKIRLKLIPLLTSGTNLLKLPNQDTYFKKVLLIPDADVSIPKKIDNAIKLPTDKLTPGYNPEKTIYSYLSELKKGTESNFSETYQKLMSKGISQDRIQEEFFNNKTNIDKRESSKHWFNNHLDLLIQYNIFTYWALDHKKEVDDFKNNLKIKLFKLAQLHSNH